MVRWWIKIFSSMSYCRDPFTAISSTQTVLCPFKVRHEAKISSSFIKLLVVRCETVGYDCPTAFIKLLRVRREAMACVSPTTFCWWSVIQASLSLLLNPAHGSGSPLQDQLHLSPTEASRAGDYRNLAGSHSVTDINWKGGTKQVGVQRREQKRRDLALYPQSQENCHSLFNICSPLTWIQH